MNVKSDNGRRTLELMLVLTVVALACVLYRTASHKIVILNLFFLPVILSAFFLGRYQSGVLALLSVIAATVASAMDLSNFAMLSSPLATGLALLLWGSVLGLTALLAGTLSDERTQKIQELHEAHLGVVEVLSRYLQSANPMLKDRSLRVAELSGKVAEQLRLSKNEVDDIRVAAMLQDMENIEITARVVRKAIDDLDEGGRNSSHTFHGTDLVQSLGAILNGALPLILDQSDSLIESGPDRKDAPFGVWVIRTVRAFDALMHGKQGQFAKNPKAALEELRRDISTEHHPAILHALEQLVLSFAPAQAVMAAAAHETRELVAADM